MLLADGSDSFDHTQTKLAIMFIASRTVEQAARRRIGAIGAAVELRR
jgi:hypothetical protein